MITLAIFTVFVTAYAIAITLYHLNNKKKSTTKYDSLAKTASEVTIKYMEIALENLQLLEQIDDLQNEIVENPGNPMSKIVIHSDTPKEEVEQLLQNAIKKLVDEKKEEILSNIDERNKTVLDTVILWDMLYCLDKKTNKRFYNNAYANKEAVVIEENCNQFLEHPITGEKLKLDLCIRFEDDTQIYVSSRAVKLKD